MACSLGPGSYGVDAVVAAGLVDVPLVHDLFAADRKIPTVKGEIFYKFFFFWFGFILFSIKNRVRKKQFPNCIINVN